MTCTRPEGRPDEAARRACAVVRRVRDDRQDQEAWARAQRCRAFPRSRHGGSVELIGSRVGGGNAFAGSLGAIGFDTPAVAVTPAHGDRGETNTACQCRTTDYREGYGHVHR